MAYFLVRLGQGPRWDPSLSRRGQAGWDQHARFMDDLAADGTVVLGGPAGDDIDTGDALVVISATDAAHAAAVLKVDPWHDSILTIRAVERWTFWLGPFVL